MKKRRAKKAGIVIGIIAAVLAAGSVWYISDYYSASGEVRQYFDADGEVQVTEIGSGLFVDGPGSENAMVFYPGAKVEYTAYLPLMHHLAKDGTDVFLVNMPAKLAIFGVKKADAVMDAYTYDHWYIGGHSLGGAAAAMYAAGEDRRVDGLVLLAAYPVKELPDIPVLELYGSEDLVLDRERLDKSQKYLPDESVVFELPGGNHAQFGNYGEQEGDGTPEISRQVQQEVAVRMINEMIEQDA